MKIKVPALLLLMGLAASCAHAQVVFATRPNFAHRAVHFVSKDKELLADVVVGLAFSAEAASAVHCHQTDQECYYTPNFTGKHYTPGPIIGYDALFAAGVIGLQHLVAWDGHQPALAWFVAGPVAAEEISSTVRNTNPADTHTEDPAPTPWK